MEKDAEARERKARLLQDQLEAQERHHRERLEFEREVEQQKAGLEQSREQTMRDQEVTRRAEVLLRHDKTGTLSFRKTLIEARKTFNKE